MLGTRVDRRDILPGAELLVGGAASPPALVLEAGAGSRRRIDPLVIHGVRRGRHGTAPDAPDAEALHTVGRARVGIQVRGADDALPSTARSARCGCGRTPPCRATGATPRPRRGARRRLAAHRRPRHRRCRLLTFAGRQGEMFIRGGYNVFPSEVAAVLANHPEVADVVIVPHTDDVLGEIGVAVVVPADPTAAHLADLRPAKTTASPTTSCPRTCCRGRDPPHRDAEGRPAAPGRRRGPLSQRAPVPSWIRWRPGGTSRSTCTAARRPPGARADPGEWPASWPASPWWPSPRASVRWARAARPIRPSPPDRPEPSPGPTRACACAPRWRIGPGSCW